MVAPPRWRGIASWVTLWWARGAARGWLAHGTGRRPCPSPAGGQRRAMGTAAKPVAPPHPYALPCPAGMCAPPKAQPHRPGAAGCTCPSRPPGRARGCLARRFGCQRYRAALRRCTPDSAPPRPHISPAPQKRPLQQVGVEAGINITFAVTLQATVQLAQPGAAFGRPQLFGVYAAVTVVHAAINMVGRCGARGALAARALAGLGGARQPPWLCGAWTHPTKPLSPPPPAAPLPAQLPIHYIGERCTLAAECGRALAALVGSNPLRSSIACWQPSTLARRCCL
jgi:hypothetical protein